MSRSYGIGLWLGQLLYRQHEYRHRLRLICGDGGDYRRRRLLLLRTANARLPCAVAGMALLLPWLRSVCSALRVTVTFFSLDGGG